MVDEEQANPDRAGGTDNPNPTPIPGAELGFIEAYELAVRTAMRTARKLLDRVDAEEVATETGQKMWDAWRSRPPAFLTAASLKAWAALVARRAALDLANKGLARFQRVEVVEMYEVGDTPASGVQLRSTDDLVRRVEADSLAHAFGLALDGLTPQQFQIHCMKRDDDMSVDEIAKKLGIKPQTVKNQLTTGNAVLKRALDVWVQESGEPEADYATAGRGGDQS